MRVKRIGEVNTFYVASFRQRVDYAYPDNFVFSPNKTYRIELKEDAFELYEYTKGGKDMTCLVCGNELSSADTSSICRICQRKMVEPKPTYYQTGWVCPKCGSVYGPMTTECSRCCPPLKITCGGTT